MHADETSITRPHPDPYRSLAVQGAVSLLACFVAVALWGAAGFGYFWPVWVAWALAVALALHAIARTATRPRLAWPSHAVLVHAEIAVLAGLVVVTLWALTGDGFWPVWPLIGLTVLFGLHALYVFRERLPPRRSELVDRVDELTRTRRGALDVQAAELRRIERDLHDGAQARLVSLMMLLGRAEDRLRDVPEVAGMLRDARLEAGAAIAELRDLARGIAPPVLADRGLVPAIEALGRRSGMPVVIDATRADPARRPVPVVETAAYFVVAESLTNAAKHARGASARVEVVHADDRLVLEIADDGPGGADPGGSGLTGLRHRVEALDGALELRSPAGAGTTIRVELPCAS
jgi:signal transduction histidine kinase